MRKTAIFTFIVTLALNFTFVESASALKLIWGVDEKGPAQKAAEEKKRKRKEKEAAINNGNPCSGLIEKRSSKNSSESHVVSRDYPLPFETVWERALEVVLSVPLSSVDKNSGVIITEWIYGSDTRKNVEITDPFSGGAIKTRRKYTVLIKSKGAETKVKVASNFQKEKEETDWISYPSAPENATLLLERLDNSISAKTR